MGAADTVFLLVVLINAGLVSLVFKLLLHIRKLREQSPRIFFMDYPDIDDEFLFPTPGWYVEWNGTVIGPFSRAQLDTLSPILQGRRSAR